MLACLGLLACLDLTLGCGDTDHRGASNGTTSSSGTSGSGGTGGGGGGGAGGTTATGGGPASEPDGPTYLKASNTDPGDLFGVSVALTSDGNLLAIGANREASSSADDETDNSTPDSGAVYLFAREASGWQQQAYLKASNAGDGDAFGTVVALSEDGTTLAVGAPYEKSNATGVDGDEDDDSATDAGAVYLFVLNGDGWQQQAYLKGSNSDAHDGFGASVAFSADGNTLVVGADGEDGGSTGVDGDPTDKSATEAGAAYVFRRSGTSWEQEGYLKASNTEAFDHFGRSVAIAADGNTLVVGAHSEDSASSGVDGDQADNSALDTGAAYVFVHDGASWAQQAYLKPGRSVVDVSEVFGSVVSLSADGTTLAVGAPGDASTATGVDSGPNLNSAPFAGAAYLFVRSGSSWVQQAYLKASNTGEADEFGHNLHLSGDGTRLAVGAALEASSSIGLNGEQSDNSMQGAGATYLFETQGDSWQQLAFIKAPNTNAGDRFGWAMGLSADGSVLAVAADREASAATGANGDQNDNSAAQAGAVYIYDDVSMFLEL